MIPWSMPPTWQKSSTVNVQLEPGGILLIMNTVIRNIDWLQGTGREVVSAPHSLTGTLELNSGSHDPSSADGGSIGGNENIVSGLPIRASLIWVRRLGRRGMEFARPNRAHSKYSREENGPVAAAPPSANFAGKSCEVKVQALSCIGTPRRVMGASLSKSLLSGSPAG